MIPMHTFQPIPVDMLDMNPFTKIGKEWALLTAGNKQESNTMTISWGGVGVLWGKNVVYVFVRDSRYTKKLIDAGDFFSLTFVSDQYRNALNYCGSHSGRNEDKIANAGLSVDYRHGIPYIDEGNLVLVCEKMSATRITDDSHPTCKGKSFKIHLIKMENPLRYVKLLPLQGDRFAFMITQGAALG